MILIVLLACSSDIDGPDWGSSMEDVLEAGQKPNEPIPASKFGADGFKTYNFENNRLDFWAWSLDFHMQSNNPGVKPDAEWELFTKATDVLKEDCNVFYEEEVVWDDGPWESATSSMFQFSNDNLRYKSPEYSTETNPPAKCHWKTVVGPKSFFQGFEQGCWTVQSGAEPTLADAVEYGMAKVIRNWWCDDTQYRLEIRALFGNLNLEPKSDHFVVVGDQLPTVVTLAAVETD